MLSSLLGRRMGSYWVPSSAGLSVGLSPERDCVTAGTHGTSSPRLPDGNRWSYKISLLQRKLERWSIAGQAVVEKSSAAAQSSWTAFRKGQ